MIVIFYQIVLFVLEKVVHVLLTGEKNLVRTLRKSFPYVPQSLFLVLAPHTQLKLIIQYSMGFSRGVGAIFSLSGGHTSNWGPQGVPNPRR